MVGEWYDSDRTLKGAVTLTGVSFFVFMAAFFSPYWLQSVPSEKLPEPKFTNLGKLLFSTYLIHTTNMSTSIHMITYLVTTKALTK